MVFNLLHARLGKRHFDMCSTTADDRPGGANYESRGCPSGRGSGSVDPGVVFVSVSGSGGLPLFLLPLH